MKKAIYTIYGASPRIIRQLIRWLIAVARVVGGRSNIGYERHKNSQKSTCLPVYDNNIIIEDALSCEVCGADQVIVSYADLVRVENGTAVRKIFHMCGDCGFLFTCERRMDREDFFEKTPYVEDQMGLRSGREVDLVELIVGMDGIDKNSNILIYAIGKGNTLELLTERGYRNAWGADVSDGVNYGGRLINIFRQSDYFSRNDIQFDVIVAVEVWEHYSRHEIDKAFAWQFEQLSANGVLVGTTSLWSPTARNEYFAGKFESGKSLLKLWHYPFFIDHTSLYTEEAMKRLGRKHGMTVHFAYFDTPYVHIMDPGKRVVFMTNQRSSGVSEYIDIHFSRKFLSVSH